jgi:hypothetical protein
MKHRPTESIATDPKRRFLCRHIFDDGHRCGSPSLRGESFCYYHIRTRRQGPGAGRAGTFVLPHAADRASIQLAIADVLCRLAAGDIDIKRGTALLYGLQVASANLGRQPQTQAQPQVEDFTEDFHYGDLAPIAEIPIEQPDAAHEPAEIAQENSESVAEPSITTPEHHDEEPDHPELAPAAPAIHLPRPTAQQLLRRRKPTFIHNSDQKDFSLYPPIREKLIFTPTPEELAESFAASPLRPDPELVLSA